ncbi:MAG: DUF2555 domain-containing protein [Cyanobacteriota bacterium]|nr:DUF2555 domain-containing protein [Cyanobacteriota bacterium]
MATLCNSKIEISTLTPADVKVLAGRLEADDYASPFEGLDDWHFLRAIAFQRPELVEPYLYLLEFEAFDEA